MKRLLYAFLSSLLLASAAFPALALGLDADEPGNVFVAGKPVVFAIKDAKADATYSLTDYFGAKITSEQNVGVKNGKGLIEIAKLEPGAYEIVCKSGPDSVNVPFVVLIDRKNAPLSIDGRVNVDSASAWLVKTDEGRKDVAHMLRLAGIPWIRERLDWPETETKRGKIDWVRYKTVADTYAAEGIHICQVFHRTAPWAMPEGNNPYFQFPTDLRDLYNYSKAGARDFKDTIQAWECWNEADIGWALLGDTYAAMLKAQYLGTKAGNPNAKVLQTSLSHITYQHIPANDTAARFARNVYDCGAGDYFDIFDWHSYLGYDEYPKMMDAYRKLMSECKISPRPAWLTEVGSAVAVPTEGPNKGYIDSKGLHAQCDYLPKSVTMGLVSGTEKYFWFVLPDYMEGAAQFGLLRPDMIANPPFAALSAAANILGLAKYTGEFKPEGTSVTTYLFSTPKGNVISAWADKETEISVPTEKSKVKVADMFGKIRELAAKNGSVTLKVGPQLQYLLDIGKTVASKAVNQRVQPEKLPVCRASTVVLSGYCALGIDRGRGYLIGTNCEPFTYTVEVYQFDEKNGAEGTVEVIAPTGWKVEDAKRTVKVGPMGREVLKFTVTPQPSGGQIKKLKAIGKFTNPPVAPTVSWLQ